MAKAALAYIGLGSNMAAPQSQIEQAITALSALPNTHILSCSPLYKTAPIGNTDQADFINGAVLLQTGLSAISLLRTLLAIETQQDRTREAKWGPRTLDLDLLMYDQEQWCCHELQLPHPRIGERKFVLQPLYDINPDLILAGQPIKHYLQVCAAQTIALLQPSNARD